MTLPKDIIYQHIGKLAVQALADARIDYTAIVKIEALKTLRQIKAILADDTLSDFECIERIVCTLEEMGSDDEL